MNEKDIVEGNKLIAEFMGASFKKYETGRMDYSFDKINYEHVQCLEYHTSFDWLMPVVEKIENITNGNSYLYAFEIGRDWCILETNDFSPVVIAKSYPKDKLKSVWECVVEFIKYFNSQTKPTNKAKQALKQ